MAATLDQLLEAALASGMLTPEQQKGRVEEQVANVMPGVLGKYGRSSMEQNEATFGKGMGLSSWNAYQQALQGLTEMEGAGTVRNQAQQSVDAAQRAAVGNSVSYATAEKNRAATSQNAAAGRDLSREQMRNAGTMQNKGMLFQGLGGLAAGAAGGAGRMFEKEIKGGLGDLAGYVKGKFGTPGAPSTPGAPGAPDMGGAMAAAGGDTDSPSGGMSFSQGPGLDLSGMETPGPAYGGGYSLDVPSLSYGSPQLDLSSLFDSTFNNNYYLDNYGGVF